MIEPKKIREKLVCFRGRCYKKLLTHVEHLGHVAYLGTVFMAYHGPLAYVAGGLAGIVLWRFLGGVDED